jgi:hypothetical protein
MKYRLEENRRLRDAFIIAFMIGMAAGAGGEHLDRSER